MSGLFDDYPLDFSRPELRAMLDLFAQTIFRPQEVEGVVLSAGLSPGDVDFTGPARLQWRSILVRARAEEKVSALLGVVREEAPAVGRRVDELLAPDPVLEPSVGLDDLSSPRGHGWRGFGAERLVVPAADTLLGVAFLAVGVARSRSICRLTSVFPGRSAFGTASLIGPDLLLTSHHVLHDWNDHDRPASAVEAWFDYELDTAGLSRQPTVIRCDVTTIAGAREHDWAVVRTATAPPEGSAVLMLGGAPPPRRDDYVSIIQHPEGGPKMIGLSHNVVRYVDDDVLQYWTDTKAGSSGSPVFDIQWRVVGLHHRWVLAPDGDGVAYRNQGRRIGRVLQGLLAQGIQLGAD